MRVGFGLGGWGEMWWRVRVDEGPEERSRGLVGWKWREVMADWRGGRLAEIWELWVRSLQLDSYQRL